MTLLIVGLIIFLGVHSVRIVAPGWRDAAIERIGFGGYRGLYALVSIVGFVLIVWGFGIARQNPVVLYDPPVFLRHLTLLLMLPVFVLLIAAYLPAGRIRAGARHPMLAAVKLWAFSHLLANGDLAGVVLFGAFLIWAVIDRIAAGRRDRAAGIGRPAVVAPMSDLIAVVGGLVLYAVFAWHVHAWLIGVSPIA